MNRVKRRRIRITLFLFALLLIGSAVLIRIRYIPFVRKAAEITVINAASDQMNKAITEQLKSGNISYDRLMYLEKDANGTVTAVRTNMVEVNRLKTEILDILGEKLLAMDTEELSIPLGNIVLPGILAGHGPGIPVKIVSLSSSDAEFENEFASAGINQTMQRMTLRVRVMLTVLTPAGTQSVSTDTGVVVAETVIVGTVPESYLQIETKN